MCRVRGFLQRVIDSIITHVFPTGADMADQCRNCYVIRYFRFSSKARAACGYWAGGVPSLERQRKPKLTLASKAQITLSWHRFTTVLNKHVMFSWTQLDSEGHCRHVHYNVMMYCSSNMSPEAVSASNMHERVSPAELFINDS